MREIIVASANARAAEHVKTILQDGQLFVNKVLTTGRDILAYASYHCDALLVLGRLNDMSAVYLAQCLPSGYDIVLLLPSGEPQTVYMSNLVTLYMPLDRAEFLDTVKLLAATSAQKNTQSAKRSEGESEILREAKKVLMNRHHISEQEAHKLLQRRSMETGLKMVELAAIIGDEHNEIH